MPFIPRLPTWNTTVGYLTYDAIADAWVDGGTILGQIYHPHRGQPGTMFGDLYFVYPKESDVLKDPRVYGIDPWEQSPPYGDIVAMQFPSVGGGTYQYWVLQVHPRWLGFPNEHLCARLRMVTVPAVEPTDPDPPGEPVPLDITVFTASDGECDACEVLNDTFACDLGETPLFNSNPFDWSCSSTGSAYWQAYYFGEGLIVNLRENGDGDTIIATWGATTTGWDFASSLECTLSSGADPRCTWPETIDVEPSA